MKTILTRTAQHAQGRLIEDLPYRKGHFFGHEYEEGTIIAHETRKEGVKTCN